jgi:AraC-like DNA-binding protein
MICGDLNFSHPAAEWLVPLFPKVIHAKAPVDHSMEWLYGTLRFMAVEAANLRPGGEAILTRLADILVIHAIRSWIEQSPQQQAGWLSALRDPCISRAIGLIHQAPDNNWTVASLAKAVGMSRSAFSELFSKLVGEPAMHYVVKYRMHLAIDYLKQGDRSIEEIAFRLGYHSVEGFSRAFKRSRGFAPGSVRENNSSATTTATLHRSSDTARVEDMHDLVAAGLD